jgi:arginyl-tRNA synthetase
MSIMTRTDLFADMRARILDALRTLLPDLPEEALARVAVEPPKDAAHGDIATNAAMVVAKAARKFRLDSTVLERVRERPVRACEELLELCSRAIALADSRNAKNSAGAVE